MARVILASASQSRAAILAAAGVGATIDPAAIDEDSVKRALKADGRDAGDAAEALAALKGQQVSRSYSGDLVIGADQILVCDERWFDKPGDIAAAREHLLALRGTTHELVAAVCVVRDGAVLWHHIDRAYLTMRPFTDRFLDDYLRHRAADLCSTVGAYRLEGRGAQLFSRITGDYFTIMGLPLLPLLDFLRGHGVVGE